MQTGATLAPRGNTCVGPVKLSKNPRPHASTEKHSAASLYDSGGTGVLPCTDLNQFTETSLWTQLSFPVWYFGEHFTWNWWDPQKLGDRTCTPPSGFVHFDDNVTGALAVYEYGVLPNIYNARGEPPAQAWLITWRMWGGPNHAPITRRHAGDRLGFLFGYDDVDSPDEQTEPSFARWRNKADPWLGGIDPATGDSTSIDCWGDVLFSVPLNQAVCQRTSADPSATARTTRAACTVRRIVSARDGVRLLVGTGRPGRTTNVVVLDVRGRLVGRLR